MNPYIGHDSQLYGVEEHRLVGGKGDGMTCMRSAMEEGWSLRSLLTGRGILQDCGFGGSI